MELVRGLKPLTAVERAFAGAKAEQLHEEIFGPRLEKPTPSVVRRKPAAQPRRKSAPSVRAYGSHSDTYQERRTLSQKLWDDERERAARRRAAYFQPGRT